MKTELAVCKPLDPAQATITDQYILIGDDYYYKNTDPSIILLCCFMVSYTIFALYLFYKLIT